MPYLFDVSVGGTGHITLNVPVVDKNSFASSKELHKCNDLFVSLGGVMLGGKVASL